MMDFSQFPQGMDFVKQFLAHNPAFSTLQTPNHTDSNSTGMPTQLFNTTTPSFAQAMGQYMMPTMDVAELDKRLNDLKIVLNFMELNTNILRQSVQTLEVQRNTIAAFNAMMQNTAASVSATQSTPSTSQTVQKTNASNANKSKSDKG